MEKYYFIFYFSIIPAHWQMQMGLQRTVSAPSVMLSFAQLPALSTFFGRAEMRVAFECYLIFFFFFLSPNYLCVFAAFHTAWVWMNIFAHYKYLANGKIAFGNLCRTSNSKDRCTVSDVSRRYKQNLY